MEFLTCDGGTITVDGDALTCSGSWIGVENPTLTVAFPELDGPDIAELLGAALVALALAYGVRLCLRLFFPR